LLKPLQRLPKASAALLPEACSGGMLRAWQPGIAPDQGALDFDGAADGVDHAAEFDEAAVAGALNDAPAERVDGGINQIAAQPPEPRQRAILVRACETAIADDIGD
jgi:hypothetical protein